MPDCALSGPASVPALEPCTCIYLLPWKEPFSVGGAPPVSAPPCPGPGVRAATPDGGSSESTRRASTSASLANFAALGMKRQFMHALSDSPTLRACSFPWVDPGPPEVTWVETEYFIVQTEA
ncbi:unnamed protein product [Merluccius merluccius]